MMNCYADVCLRDAEFEFAISLGNAIDVRSVTHFPFPLSLRHTNKAYICRIAELLIGSVAIGSDQFVKRCSGQTNIKFSPFKMSSRVPTGPRLFSPSVAVRAPHLGTGRHRNDSTGSNADDNHLVLGSGREGPS